MRIRWVMLTVIVALLLGACASGPSDTAIAADRAPTTTTTTEPPPPGVIVVVIEGGRFRPSNLKVDLNEATIVEWRHEDSAEREYMIESSGGDFESSGPLNNGDVFQVDFGELGEGIFRYFSFLGNNRIPGSVDTRPDQ